MNTLVNFELSQLLANKNYPMEFISVGEIEKVPTNIPTIAEVVMWLYENYGIWIGVELTDNTRKFYFQPTIWTSKDRDYHDEDMIDQAKSICKWKEWQFNSPTEAYQEAIKYTLTNLI